MSRQAKGYTNRPSPFEVFSYASKVFSENMSLPSELVTLDHKYSGWKPGESYFKILVDVKKRKHDGSGSVVAIVYDGLEYETKVRTIISKHSFTFEPTHHIHDEKVINPESTGQKKLAKAS